VAAFLKLFEAERSAEKKPLILIVDDDANIVRSLSLSMDGHYRVKTALGGKEALQLIAQEAPDLILVDQRMPDMTGLELMETAAKKHPGCKGLFVSGYMDSAALLEASKLTNIVGFIRKPWDIRDLLDKIEKALSDR
jgi:DNA-binding NtrC family response regulator